MAGNKMRQGGIEGGEKEAWWRRRRRRSEKRAKAATLTFSQLN